MTNKDYIRLNNRDINFGLRRLMAIGMGGKSISQEALSVGSYQNEMVWDEKSDKHIVKSVGVTAYQISKMLNIEDPYTMTIQSLSRVIAQFNMTLIEFFQFIKDNEFKLD